MEVGSPPEQNVFAKMFTAAHRLRLITLLSMTACGLSVWLEYIDISSLTSSSNVALQESLQGEALCR